MYTQRFVVPWESFLVVYEATVGVLDETTKQSLKSVLGMYIKAIAAW